MHPIALRLPSLGLVVWSDQAMLAAGIAVAWWLAPRWAERHEGLDPRAVRRAQIALTLVGLVGARLHFIANFWPRFAAEPAELLRLGGGGMHLGGGVLAVVLLAPAVCRRVGMPMARVADALAPTMGLALMFTRVGCFLHGCCFGTACNWLWCVPLPRDSPIYDLQGRAGLLDASAAASLPVHPLPLYFAAAALLVTAVTRWVEGRKRFDGEAALAGLVLLGATSFGLEFLRAEMPGRVYWGPLPQLAWTALGLAAGALGAWAIAERRAPRLRGQPAMTASGRATPVPVRTA